MKGISPLIAGVLMIAFTLAVATIIGGWLTSVSRTTTETVGTGTTETVECSKALIDVVDYDCSSQNLTIVVNNMGSVNLTSFSIAATIGGTPYVNTTADNYDTVLEPGQVTTLTSTTTAGALTKIRVISGTCPNAYDEITSITGETC